MAKLTYWIAPVRNDHKCYSLRAKTKSALVAQLAKDPEWSAKNYEPVKKVTVEYRDGFDLMEQCLYGECAGGWE